MKMILIKMGKAWHTLRRDGLIRGGRRVLNSFLGMFRRVRPGNILFITGGVGDSARYRTDHVAEELQFHGLTAAITVQDNPFLVSYADKFSVFIFHRVLFTPSAEKLLARLKALGKEVIFETDDLVFDPQYLRYMDYFKVMNALERKLYENGVGGEILTDSYVKTATTTTSFLAEKLAEKGKRVFIVPNRLSRADVDLANVLFEKRKSRKAKDIVRMGYLSGTPSHNKDFATIVPALKEILKEYANVRLVLVGPLDTENALNEFADRIETLAFAPRKKFFGYIADLDINLAPLEIGNPFCESKSELKFFEAGIMGVPTVAAATRTFCEAIADGEDGFVASNISEWKEKLGQLVASPTLREKMGEAARKTILEKYTTKNASNEEYYNYLRGKIV